MKPVVHVLNDSADGKKVERAQAAMARWNSLGYSVCPVPEDGKTHIYEKPCPACEHVKCGDCGDDLRAQYDVVGRNEDGTPYSWDVSHVHADDNSPQCRGRRDAVRRKPGHFCCLECGQPPDEAHLKKCPDKSGGSGGKVAVQSADLPAGFGQDFATVSCRNCQSEIHLTTPDPDGPWQDWGLSEYCAGTKTVGGGWIIATAHTPQWSTAQLQRDFTVEGFSMCICVARRKADGKLGSLDFDHRPRFYFGWQPYES